MTLKWIGAVGYFAHWCVWALCVRNKVSQFLIHLLFTSLACWVLWYFWVARKKKIVSIWPLNMNKSKIKAANFKISIFFLVRKLLCKMGTVRSGFGIMSKVREKYCRTVGRGCMHSQVLDFPNCYSYINLKKKN